jgi:three-Cys-motif partner protein
MGREEACKYGGRKLSNENCENPDPVDGQANQSVGNWSRRKHARLTEYLEATREVRRAYIPPKGSGGAAFIDLFAGPGRVRVRDSRETEEGSALIALHHSAAPFTHVIMCDLEPSNIAALRARTAHDPRAHVIEGDCNERIDDIVALVPRNGLNLAFFDPFGATVFHWRTIQRLASVRRMDLLIHFPTGTIKRNIFNPTQPDFDAVITRMLGTDSWRERVRGADDAHLLIDVLREQLVTLGYAGDRVRTLSISTQDNLKLYHLVFASKSDAGTRIWESISRHDGAQRGFGF